MPEPKDVYVNCDILEDLPIPNEQEAIRGMKKLGRITIISIYGERFDNDLARAYFKAINLETDKIKGNVIFMKDFTEVKRYTRKDVESWGCKEIIETPIGYFCIINSSNK